MVLIRNEIELGQAISFLPQFRCLIIWVRLGVCKLSVPEVLI